MKKEETNKSYGYLILLQEIFFPAAVFSTISLLDKYRSMVYILLHIRVGSNAHLFFYILQYSLTALITLSISP